METAKEKFTISKGAYFGKPALIAGVVGLALTAAGFTMDAAQFYHSWLVAFVFWVTLGLGGLFFTMIHHAGGAEWSTVLRRTSESVMMTLPLMLVFFIPVIFGAHDLFHWTHEEAVAGDALLQKKAPYLNMTFFTIRGVVYFAIWSVLAILLYKKSIKQDETGDPELVPSMRRISAPGLVLFGLTATFAAFDWLMSLDPHWYSTIFGLYVFAGALLSIISFLVLSSLAMRSKNLLNDIISAEHYHDLGKFLFGFTVFWGYMAFSQYFLIWYANIPEETIYFHHRWQGGWKYITMILVFGKFLIPFIVLLPRFVKRNFNLMGLIAGWVFVMHWVDVYWMVLPNLHQHDVHFSWMDITATLGIGGVVLWYFWNKLTSTALIPVKDPNLDKSIHFTNN
jgi:hypothetical protein